MSDNRYNGWVNYETWNVALWQGNDEGSYRYWRSRAWESLESESDKDGAERLLAEWIGADIEENTPELSGFYSDILTANLQAVDCREIAENWIADVYDEWLAQVEEEAQADSVED